MKKKYITPKIKSYAMDFQISMQLSSGSNPVAPLTPAEPGDGSGGIGGENNGSGESGWERASQYSQGINSITPSSQQQNQPAQNDWNNLTW